MERLCELWTIVVGNSHFLTIESANTTQRLLCNETHQWRVAIWTHVCARDGLYHRSLTVLDSPLHYCQNSQQDVSVHHRMRVSMQQIDAHKLPSSFLGSCVFACVLPDPLALPLSAHSFDLCPFYSSSCPRSFLTFTRLPPICFSSHSREADGCSHEGAGWDRGGGSQLSFPIKFWPYEQPKTVFFPPSMEAFLHVENQQINPSKKKEKWVNELLQGCLFFS